MKLKNVMVLVLSLLVLVSVPVPAMATQTEPAECTVTAESIRTFPGKTVTIPVSIQGNPGFHNFAVFLEYDAEKLTLLSIDTEKDQIPYLCGTLVSTNKDWKNAEQKTGGYIVAESPDVITDNGVLFAVTFEVNEELTEATTVTPVVRYIRSNTANTSEFADISAAVTPGTVTTVKPGDVTGDHLVDYDDVMLSYKAFLGEVTLDETQLVAADINGNKKIDESDVDAIYNIYRGLTT